MKVFLITIIFFAFTACNYSKDKSKGGDDDLGPLGANFEIVGIEGDTVVVKLENGDTKKITADKVDYALVNGGVLKKYCTSCHGKGKADGNAAFATYKDTLKFATRIKVRMIDAGDMPPGSAAKPNKFEKRAFEIWLANGKKEKADSDPVEDDDNNNKGDNTDNDNNNSSSLTVTAVTSEGVKLSDGVTYNAKDFTFSLLKKSVLQKYCLGCHDDGNTQGRSEFGSKSRAESKAKDIWLRANYKQSRTRPMPPSGSGLAAVELKALKFWVDALKGDTPPTDNDSFTITGATKDGTVYTKNSKGESKAYKKAEVDYDLINDGVLKKHCTGCHSGTAPDGNVDFETLDAVKQHAERIWARTDYRNSGEGPMPPSEEAPPTNYEIEALKIWLLKEKLIEETDDGGTDSSDEPTSPPSPSVVTFKQINDEILQPFCVSCHSKGNKKVGKALSLDSYDDVREFIALGNPQKRGLLYRRLALSGDHEKTMPLNPFDPDPAADKVIRDGLLDLLAKWIDAGALENKGSKPPTTADNNVTFAEVNEKVLEKYSCTSCHEADNDIDGKALSLVGYDDVREFVALGNPEKRGALYRRAALSRHKKQMPPYGYDETDSNNNKKLQKEALELLAQWIDGGAKR